METTIRILVRLLLTGVLLVVPLPVIAAGEPCEWAWTTVRSESRLIPQVQHELDHILETCSYEDAPQAIVTTRPAGSGPDRGMGGNVEQWRPLVAVYFADVDRMLCLMSYESGGNPDALNSSSGAAGLFQIMPFWWEYYGGDRFDPERNVQVARWVYDQQGYTAWSPYNRGLCR